MNTFKYTVTLNKSKSSFIPNSMFIYKIVLNRFHHWKLVTAVMFYQKTTLLDCKENYRTKSTSQVVTHMSLRTEYVTINDQFILI